MLDENTGLFYIGKEIIQLTLYESDLLEYLIINKNRIADYKELLEVLYGDEELTNRSRSKLLQIILRLRKKLQKYMKINKIRNKGVILEWIQKN